MSDIDKILRDAIDGYEAPFDSAAWENISSQLSPVEDAFRASVEGHEVPYNPKAWSAIKNKINPSSIWMQWVAGSAAAIGIVAGTIAFLAPGERNTVDEVSRIEADKNTSIVLSDYNPTENKADVFSQNHNEETNSSSPEQVNSTPENGDDESASDNANTDNNSETTRTTNGEIIPEDIISVPVDENENESHSNEIVNNQETNDLDNSNEVYTEKYDATFTCNTHEICQGETILFNPKVTRNGVLYIWDFGDGEYGSTAATAHTFNSPGDYNVTLTLRDKNTNKVLANYSESVIINKLPNIDFSWEKINAVIPTVNFINLSDEGLNWIWKVDGKVVSDVNKFEHTFRSKGSHTVELSAENEFGCSNKQAERIEIEEDYNLLAPNAFTPNGDNMNETFIPTALKLMNNEFTMTVYSQDGTMIFQTSNVNNPWDGRDMTDNSIAPDGGYVWVVQLKNGNGMVEEYKGQVFITR